MVKRWVALVIAGCCACGRGPFWEFEQSRVSCDRADFLFVIDDSGSMRKHQQQLTRTFPSFIAGIRQTIDLGVDIHVGVVTTNRYPGNDDRCRELGALVTRTTGTAAGTVVCGPFAEGGAYISSADDLTKSFECVAKVGANGSQIEQPLAAALGALDPDSPAARCNAGFLRADALLTIVMVSDENDQSPGDVGDYVDAFAEIKGSRDAFTVVSLAAPEECGDGRCSPDRLRAAAEFAEFGFSGWITGDFDAHFGAAIELVGDACAANDP